jgi:hypothetical protein
MNSTNSQSPPAAVIDYVKTKEPLPLIVALVWKDIQPRMEKLIQAGKTVEQVCAAIVQRGNYLATDLIKSTKVNKTDEKIKPDGFNLASYQVQSGAFIISMSYLPKKNQTYQVQVKFKVKPDICRRCGSTEGQFTEKDLCNNCSNG